MSKDIYDDSPLTPEKFLYEISTSGIPDIKIHDKVKIRKNIKYVLRFRETLRYRLLSEYFGQLRQQSLTN